MELRKYRDFHFLNQRRMLSSFIIIAGLFFLCMPSLWMTSVYLNIPLRNSIPLRKPCNKFLPKAVCIGVTKSGTGALRMFLGAHPDIDIGPGKSPELGVWEKPSVNFFDLHYEDGLEWYRNKMPCSEPSHIVIDHTPQYFKKEYVPKRVYMFNSTIRLLLVIREPISRTVSQYLQMKQGRPNFDQELDIESFLLDDSGRKIDKENNAISQSSYVLHIKKWLNVFKLQQIYIVNGDEFRQNPLRQLKEMETFLGVKPYFTSDIVYYNETRGFYCIKTTENGKGFQCGGENKGRTHPELKKSTLDQLADFFEPYNKKLFRTIGKRFNWTLPK